LKVDSGAVHIELEKRPLRFCRHVNEIAVDVYPTFCSIPRLGAGNCFGDDDEHDYLPYSKTLSVRSLKALALAANLYRGEFGIEIVVWNRLE
jgi:hypothetical protein